MYEAYKSSLSFSLSKMLLSSYEQQCLSSKGTPGRLTAQKYNCWYTKYEGRNVFTLFVRPHQVLSQVSSPRSFLGVPQSQLWGYPQQDWGTLWPGTEVPTSWDSSTSPGRDWVIRLPPEIEQESKHLLRAGGTPLSVTQEDCLVYTNIYLGV